jgi:hypothetical protein
LRIHASRIATAAGRITGLAQERQATTNTTKTKVIALCGIRARDLSERLVTTVSPRFQPPAEDKTDSETGDRHCLRTFPRVVADVLDQILNRAHLRLPAPLADSPWVMLLVRAASGLWGALLRHVSILGALQAPFEFYDLI